MTARNRKWKTTFSALGLLAAGVFIAVLMSGSQGRALNETVPAPLDEASKPIIKSRSVSVREARPLHPTLESNTLLVPPANAPEVSFTAEARAASLEAAARSESERRTPKYVVVEGQVFDESKRPIGGAEITVFDRRDHDRIEVFLDKQLTTRTLRNGTFEFRAMSPFRGWVVIDQPGYARLEDHLRFDAPGYQKRSYVLAQAADRLTGRVLEDGTRKPVRATVTLNSSPKNAGRYIRMLQTNERGEFSFSRLPIGTPAYVFVTSDTHLPGFKALPFETPGEEQDIEVLVSPGKRLRVHVLDENGQPIAGARVQSDTVMSVFSGSDGVANVLTTAMGDYPLDYHVDAAGFLDLETQIPGTLDEVEVRLQSSPAFLVTVWDDKGNPINHAAINVWTNDKQNADRGWTDEHGIFQALPRSLDLASVTVNHSAYLGKDIPLAESGAGIDDIQVTLESGTAGISGQVLSSEGTPVSDFRIWLRRQPSEGSTTGTLSRYFEGTDGRFQIADLPEGAYDLTIAQDWEPRVRNRQTGIVRDLQLQHGQMLGQLSIQLQPTNK